MGANTFFSITTRWLRKSSLKTAMKARGDESFSGKISMIKNIFTVIQSVRFFLSVNRGKFSGAYDIVDKQVNTMARDWT